MSRRPQTFSGMAHKKVVAVWFDTTDFVDSGSPSLRGSVSSASAMTMTASTASFGTLTNVTVAIVDGKGRGQERMIVSNTATVLTLDRPWENIPNTTSVYQVGGVHWRCLSSWMRFSPNEATAQRRFEMSFEPTEAAATASLVFSNDIDGEETQRLDQTSAAGAGIKSARGEKELVVDLSWRTGLISKQMPGGKEFFSTGRRYTRFDMEGWTNEDVVRLYQILYEGVLSNAG